MADPVIREVIAAAVAQERLTLVAIAEGDIQRLLYAHGLALMRLEQELSRPEDTEEFCRRVGELNAATARALKSGGKTDAHTLLAGHQGRLQ